MINQHACSTRRPLLSIICTKKMITSIRVRDKNTVIKPRKDQPTRTSACLQFTLLPLRQICSFLCLERKKNWVSCGRTIVTGSFNVLLFVLIPGLVLFLLHPPFLIAVLFQANFRSNSSSYLQAVFCFTVSKHCRVFLDRVPQLCGHRTPSK